MRKTFETKANIVEEMQAIRAHLESDEEENLRFRVLRPLTRVARPPVTSGNGVGGIPGISTMPSNAEELTNGEGNEINASYTPWQESTLTRSMITNSTAFSLRSGRKFNSSYHSAGLFDDCRHAFFNNDTEVSVYRLGNLRGMSASPSFSRIFIEHYKHGECIRNVAPSKARIIIVTNKRLLVFSIGADTPTDIILHGDWDPSGLTCHESNTHLVVFLGQCQRNRTNNYNGRIKIYRYRIDDQAKKLPVSNLNMPANDCPKRFSFHPDSRILTCITRIQNKLLVWRLDDDFLSSLEPFQFLKNKYTAVSARSPIAPTDRR